MNDQEIVIVEEISINLLLHNLYVITYLLIPQLGTNQINQNLKVELKIDGIKETKTNH